ncbi:hypothetical protein ACFQ0G_03430 [Streptomyces chiangmaiensis]
MPFADELINSHTAESLTRAVHTVLPGAELASLRAAAEQLDSLSLRERADLLRDALLADVPGDYAELARVVRAAQMAPRRSAGGSSGRSRAPSPRRPSPSGPTTPSTTRWRSWPI